MTRRPWATRTCTAITGARTSGCWTRRGRWSSSCTPTPPTPTGSTRARGRVRHRRPDGHPGPAEPGRALHVGRRVGRLDRRGRAEARRGRAGQRGAPAGGHLRPAVRGRRPSTTSSCASCWSTCREPAEALAILHRLRAAGRHRHGDRGRPRLGVLPPGQPRGPGGDPVPGRAAGAGRGRRADRPAALSPDGRRGARRGARRRPGWSMPTRAAPRSWTASRGARSPR